MSDILFIGNGINRAFDNDSWEEIIKKISNKYSPGLAYEDISSLPFPMQVVAATGDTVDKAMKMISKDMNIENSVEKDRLIKNLLAIPVENIITANYTFELEQSYGTGNKISQYRKARCFAKPCKGKEEKFGLFRYYQSKEPQKKIWHIHGDISKPSTIIMGSYYYGKLLNEIETYSAKFIRNYKIHEKENDVYIDKSWVDLFLKNNVYILGFGLDTSEIDIWWLISCKKRNFPDTKIYFYKLKSEISPAYRALLNAYKIEIMDNIPFNGDYKQFYSDAIDDISSRIEGGQSNENI